MATTYHEPTNELSAQARNVHRALTSLIEELEAIDWYNQRVDVTQDEELKAILAHNRDEEVEHAAMALEWLRRTLPQFDQELRTYLFSSGPITAVEESAGGGEGGSVGGSSDKSLGVGKNVKGE